MDELGTTSVEIVHVWVAPLDVAPPTLASLVASLNPAERARAGRYRHPRDARRFSVARGWLRQVLGGELGVAGTDVVLIDGPGKPCVAGGAGPFFNVSHAGELALIAVAGHEVGVDVEHVSSGGGTGVLDAAGVACSSREAAALRQLPRAERADAFVALWTAKEAYLKATGQGLSVPPNEVEVGTEGGGAAVRVHLPNGPTRWWVRHVRPAPGYVAAVAAEGCGWDVALHAAELRATRSSLRDSDDVPVWSRREARREGVVRVLCTCLPGHGHFNPMLALAQALVRNGHEVAFATAADFCPHIERTGFAAFPAGMSLSRQIEEARRRYPDQDRLSAMDRFEQFVPRMLAGVAAPARAADLVPLVEDWKPDLLVHDETEFAGPAVAAAARIPWADQSVGILRPLAMARLASETLSPLSGQLGVDVGPFGGLFRYLYLDVAPKSLQSPQITEIAVAHPVQNATIDPGAEGETLPEWVHHLPERPVVYVSLGTVFNAKARGVFTAVLDGLRDEPVNAIVTVGPDNDPAEFGPQPEHIHIERFIPQSSLLPFCDAVVNQGGTAILPILAHGLPLLLLPQGANQFHNAEACVAAGVGRRLLPAEVSPEAVRQAVRALLHDEARREAARRVQRELSEMPGPEHGVALLERLAAERRPVLRRAGEEADVGG